MTEVPCAISVQFPTPDRGRISLQWLISRERADAFAEELRDRLGEPDNEFFAGAEVIDRATREAFSGDGAVIQHERSQ